MGLPVEKEGIASREVEGAVDMMVDATQHYDKPLTEDRLWGWQAALFPSGRSGVRRISRVEDGPEGPGPAGEKAGKEPRHFANSPAQYNRAALAQEWL